MTWRETADGSIEDETGKVLLFSKDRFVRDICLGSCCFICGAQPHSKLFNNEHVIPNWLIRKYGLVQQALSLPNYQPIKYSKHKIPCCSECNSLMGRKIEELVRNLVNAGSNAIQNYIKAGNGLDIFVWLGLLFLKSHLKDRDYRMSIDERAGAMKIGDLYDWETLHHVHSVVRCFVNGAGIDQGALGSMFAVGTIERGGEEFDFADLFAAQTMMIRLGEVALIATFNDSGAACQAVMPLLKRLEGPLTPMQARELMVEFAFMNLSLQERPRFYPEYDLANQTLFHRAIIPKEIRLGKLDYSLRGKLLRQAFRELLAAGSNSWASPDQVEKTLHDGTFTVLWDEDGKFVRDGKLRADT